VHRFLTPLLRRAYLLLAVVLIIYFAVHITQHSAWNKERLYQRLVSGDPEQRLIAAADLVDVGGQTQLVRALRSDSAAVRELAVHSLWQLWFHAAGEQPFRMVRNAENAIDHHDYPQALGILNQLVKKYPRFAEGWNRRGTLYWMLGQYDLSIEDGLQVVALNPDHYAAWQGIGLCQLHLGDVSAACQSLRTALKIHPHDPNTRRYLRRSEEMLRKSPRKSPASGDLV
jgi:tetratricopeptide (TPR) repeat protein